jgi:hypothetical protein
VYLFLDIIKIKKREKEDVFITATEPYQIREEWKRFTGLFFPAV